MTSIFHQNKHGKTARFPIIQQSRGVLLFGAALAAIVMANTDASTLYDAIIHFPVRSDGEMSAHLTVQLIVKNGLMAVFFLAVGLEVKYELLQGALNSRARAAFPAIAVLGGMAASALIYSLVTASAPAGRFRPPPISPSPSACWPCWEPGC